MSNHLPPFKNLRARIDAARELLPSVVTQYAALSDADKTFLGHCPDRVTSLVQAVCIEKLATRFAAAPAAVKPVAKPTAPAPVAKAPAPNTAQKLQTLGSTVAALATDTRPEVRKPMLDGLKQSLAARLGLSEVRTCTRAEFKSLSPSQRAEFCRKGGRIVEPAAAPVSAISAGAKVITRDQFHLLTPTARTEYIRGGGKLS